MTNPMGRDSLNCERVAVGVVAVDTLSLSVCDYSTISIREFYVTVAMRL